jgi:hypothetical protein
MDILIQSLQRIEQGGCPSYHRIIIYGHSNFKDVLLQRYTDIKELSYSKNIYKLEPLSGYVLEIEFTETEPLYHFGHVSINSRLVNYTLDNLNDLLGKIEYN